MGLHCNSVTVNLCKLELLLVLVIVSCMSSPIVRVTL